MTQTVFVGAGETAEAAVITSNGGFKAAGKGRSFRCIGKLWGNFLAKCRFKFSANREVEKHVFAILKLRWQVLYVDKPLFHLILIANFPEFLY